MTASTADRRERSEPTGRDESRREESGRSSVAREALREAAAESLGRIPAPPDAQLVEETRREIRQIVQEIADLAHRDLPPAEFHSAFLQRVVSALAAVGGAVWLLDENRTLNLRCQENLHAAGIGGDRLRQARHAKLLEQTIASGKGALVPPGSGGGDEDEAGNPTEHLVIVGTLVVDQQVRGLVEIFQRPGGGPNTQRGYLRFLTQMCALASNYLQSRELRRLAGQQSHWKQLEGFVRGVHRSLDVTETCYTIANDGRQLIGCDRVSVVAFRGGSCEVMAISGLDSIDLRSAAVMRLAALAEAVSATNEPLWYTGERDDLPPQIEAVLETYIDSAHARALGLVPLRGEAAAPARETAGEAPLGRLVGLLIVEQLQGGEIDDDWQTRSLNVATHSGPALANALEHSNIFLLPLWKACGHVAALFDGNGLPKTLTVLGILAAIVLALIVVPWDFAPSTPGALQPAVQRDVYAALDGDVIEVLVDHGSQVQSGDTVVRLRNMDLEVGVASLLGQRTTIAEQMRALQRAIIEGGRRVDPEEQNRLNGELAQLKKSDESLQQQLLLYREKEKQLVVRSPIAGQVTTWQLRDLLQHRPVTKGQVLMTVVDPSQQWELHLDVPESRMGHIAAAARASREPLQVSFMLATHPGEEFTAQVIEIHSLADTRGPEGSTVRIRASLDKAELPELRPGAAVTAKVHCGQRPLGYVLLHDVIAFVQKKVLFWL